jgi:hypothetical protein
MIPEKRNRAQCSQIISLMIKKNMETITSSNTGTKTIFAGQAARNKYFNNDGIMTKLGTEASAKLDAIGKEEGKYVTSSPALDKYNDWLVE